MRYKHTQKSPLFWILLTAAGVILILGKASIAAWAACLALVMIALCFGRLTVWDKGDSITLRFGPLPVFGASFDYSEISGVASARSDFFDGWGFHWLPGRGRIYNVWGFDCVQMTVGGRSVRIGTDDVDGLLQTLRERTAAQRSHRS